MRAINRILRAAYFVSFYLASWGWVSTGDGPSNVVKVGQACKEKCPLPVGVSDRFSNANVRSGLGFKPR